MADSTVRRHQTLLIVDDQPINILVLYQTFSAEYRVLKASSGVEALQVCRAQRPDLVLLDVMMPGMDGFEVCRRLKADPLTWNIPVIFVTAHDDTDTETRGLELGAVDFIVKPVKAPVVQARVRTHLSFAHTRSLLGATLEASTEGVLVVDLSGGISSMNQAFIRMWGLPPSLQGAVAHEPVFSFMDNQLSVAADPAPGAGPSLKDIQPGQPFDAMELVLQGDRCIELYGKPLEINGNPRGQVLVFSEVTERRRAARELMLLNESLESRIEERTRELEAATELAQTASKAKSDFLSNMSHEIRTPINAVIGLAHLTLATELNPRQRDVVGKIQQSGEHLLGLVNRIIDFSKIEAEMLELEEIDFQLQNVFDSVSAITAQSARDKGLHLVFDIDHDLSQDLRGDPMRIGQVLLNYVGNAIKFTAQGDVRVRATVRPDSDTGFLLRIEVEDTGIGIPDAHIAQLFQRFSQVDASTTRLYGGTGLGLAVSKQLAELMGGEAGVRSQPGQGSVFWFTCRVRQGSAAAIARPGEPGTPQVRDARKSLRGRRILLVEDNLLNQEVTTGMLEGVGISVTVAQHGREALDHLACDTFDGVLMDIQMPVMDGLQATRLIRENPALAQLPVLALTANARSEDRARCMEAGMNDFITKPVMPDRLFASLAKWLPPCDTCDLRDSCESFDAGSCSAGMPDADAPGPGATPGTLKAFAYAADPEVIDLSILAMAVGDDLQMIQRYGALFVERTRESIAELEAALEQGDIAALADLGHRMKSSARMVGALGLAGLCESLEGLRHSSALTEVSRKVEEISLMFDRISTDMNAWMQSEVP